MFDAFGAVINSQMGLYTIKGIHILSTPLSQGAG